MAANKFATMLHRNTHRMIFLLIYTALEWILIILLLFNALFSYLISNFASFFGLKPPCILCSRIDHLFEPGKSQNSYRDFLCESHAGEISKLGFCSNHRQLAEAGDMCEDCAASRPGEVDRSVSLLLWMKRSERGEKDLRCSCCGVGLESGFYTPYLPLKTQALDVLERARKDESVEVKDGDSGEELEQRKEKEEEGEKEDDSKGETFLPSPRAIEADSSMYVLDLRMEKLEDERILSIELIDSSTMMRCDHPRIGQDVAAKDSMALEIPAVKYVEMNDSKGDLHTERHLYALLPTDELEKQQVSEEDVKVIDEANCEISIGSEICDDEQIENTKFHEIVSQPDVMVHQHLKSFNEAITEDPEYTVRRVKHLKICPAINEMEDERMPETPTTPNYMDGFPVLHKRFLLERRESGSESFDGSIAGDIDNLEPLTIDRLKTALKSERKALIALFAELEEERNASAIAANQTMAMITRLQEEKAAMQMEALQYHRMMEEQSEYDQEALQLLNELMVKREREKQELEKDLEAYRLKVRAYEAVERRKMAKGSGSGTSSSAEDSDDVLCESHEGDQESSQNTPTSEFLGSMEDEDAVKHLISLDDSLVEFEEERLSIHEQLKALEEKLIAMCDNDIYANAKPSKHFPVENGHGINGDHELSGNSANEGYVNGSNTNGSLHVEPKSMGIKGKRLLPLFDATNKEELSINHDAPDANHNKSAIAEEVDRVYARLRALEADREFLKHCLSSLKKGDRGMNLLQEILQHLRDLRSHARHAHDI